MNSDKKGYFDVDMRFFTVEKNSPHNNIALTVYRTQNINYA
jgi:hypothetical protein